MDTQPSRKEGIDIKMIATNSKLIDNKYYQYEQIHLQLQLEIQKQMRNSEER